MLRFIVSLTPYVPQCQTQHLLAQISCQILGSSLSLRVLRYVTTAYLLLTLFSTEKAPLAYPTFVTVVLQEEAEGFVLSENNSSRNEVTDMLM